MLIPSNTGKKPKESNTRTHGLCYSYMSKRVKMAVAGQEDYL